MSPPDAAIPSPAKLAVFVSGTGRLLRVLHDRIAAARLDARLVLVVASRPCPAADWATDHRIAVAIEPGEIPPARLAGLLADDRPDWIVLTGYLRRLAVLPEFRGRIVNIHPALLPDFGGRGFHGARVHEAVLASGASESGPTVHLVDEQYDHGPILAQRRCPVLSGDTPETLAARVFTLEQDLLPETLAALFSGRLAANDPS